MFSGDVTDLSFLEGEAAVYLDGNAVDPGALESSDDGSTGDGSTDDGSTEDDSTDSTDLPHAVTVDGRETDGLSGYEITVSGDLARDTTTEGTDGTTKWDTLEDEVSGGTVVGVVDEGVDQFRFSGEVTSMDVDGKASLSFQRDDA
jgi:hypothetical protein